jgi:hypothetical protein
MQKPFAFRVEQKFRERHIGVFPTLAEAVRELREGSGWLMPTEYDVYACFPGLNEECIPTEWLTESLSPSRDEAEAVISRRLEDLQRLQSEPGSPRRDMIEKLDEAWYQVPAELPFEDQVKAYMETSQLQWLPEERIAALDVMLDGSELRLASPTPQ